MASRLLFTLVINCIINISAIKNHDVQDGSNDAVVRQKYMLCKVVGRNNDNHINNEGLSDNGYEQLMTDSYKERMDDNRPQEDYKSNNDCK